MMARSLIAAREWRCHLRDAPGRLGFTARIFASMRQTCYSRRSLLGLSAALLMPLMPRAEAQPPLRVGPDHEVKTLAEAARRARDGQVLEVQAGDYVRDVTAWTQNDLTLRAINGRVRMIADGASAQGKGIFVTSGERMRIEGFDFLGCRVPDQNGAGIRLERGSLFLKDCRFLDNENGVLAGNDAQSRLEAEDCEFGPIVRHEGQNHNIYVGAIAFFRAMGCYFHHGESGHLLKSRAAVNHIFYNRLTDELGGHASYELEFPNGGLAVVLGNVIQQGAGTENPHIISYGAEGYRWPRNELHLVHNTIVDQRGGEGIYLRVSPPPAGAQVPEVRLRDNLLLGKAYVGDPALWSQWEAKLGNFVADGRDFVNLAGLDLALRPSSSLRGKAVDPGKLDELSLRPTHQFHLPRGTTALRGPARNPGAVQQ